MSPTTLAAKHHGYKSQQSDRAVSKHNLTTEEICEADSGYLGWLLQQHLESSFANQVRAELGLRQLMRPGVLERKVSIEIDLRYAALMLQLIEAGFGSLERRTSPSESGKLNELRHCLATQLRQIGGAR